MDQFQELKNIVGILKDRPTKAEMAQAIKTVLDYVKNLDLKGVLSSELRQAEVQMQSNVLNQILTEVQRIEGALRDESNSNAERKVRGLDATIRRELKKLEAGTSSKKSLADFQKLISGEVLSVRNSIPKIKKLSAGETIEVINGETEKKIKMERIEGLDELKKKIDRAPQGGINAGIIGRDLIKDIDLTDQLDGITKTFQLQAIWNVVSVSLSSYPYGALRKGIDFTWTPTSITFTSEIDAETQLSVGQRCILTVVQA